MNYPNPDPYDSRDDIGLSVPMYTPNEITEEEKLYHELLGLYQACQTIKSLAMTLHNGNILMAQWIRL